MASQSKTDQEAPSRPVASATAQHEPPAVNGRMILIATILASSIVFIDGSVVNVALPALQEEFGATGAQVQWVVESYALFLAALILVGGALGDTFGRKRIFLIGVVLFAITSVLCGLAPSIELLIAARAAQGVAGALLTPASLAIIRAAFHDDTERGAAIGAWSGFTAITTAFGPVLGGFLVDNASWRWVFFINVPLAAIVVAVAIRGIPESRDEQAGRLDFLGATLATVGLGALVFGLIEAPLRGWSDTLVVASLALGVASLIAFVIAELRLRAPMVPLSLFRSRTFSGANLLTLLVYGAFGGALFWLPFNLIQVQGYSATAAGSAFLPSTIILFALSRWTGALAGRIGAKVPLTVGPCLVAVALLLMARIGIGGNYWTTFFPASVVFGLGLAITVSPLTTAVMGAVPERQAGIASGINNSVARTASLLAIAVFGIAVTTAFTGSLSGRMDAIPNLSPEVRAEVEAQRTELAAAQPPEGIDPETSTAIATAIDESFIDGFRVAMFTGAAMCVVGAGLAWWLVEGKRTE